MTGPDIASRVEAVMVTSDRTIKDAIEQLERAGTGALVLCDGARKLRGLITDGDIRRAILQGIPFERSCEVVAKRNPVVAPTDTSASDALRIMDHAMGFAVNQLPIVLEDGTFAGLLLRRDLVANAPPGLSAVIMAGGYGRRLLPLTSDTPKPMLPVGDRPLLERTISRLRGAGISRVNITTHYLSQRIASHFGDGSAFGVELTYTEEAQPLGTAGGVRLAGNPDEPLLVINGDILTDVNFGHMLEYHREQRADVTVGVRQYDIQVPYGVMTCDGPHILALEEKPTHRVFVNAGIYLLEPHARRRIPRDQRFDMTDLIQQLLAEGRPVAGFPIIEYWLDVGKQTDYERAQRDLEDGLVGTG